MESSKTAKLIAGLLLLVAGWLALANAQWIGASLAYPYKKDMRSGYMMAKGIREGLNPFAAPDAAHTNRWLDTTEVKASTNPTPHSFLIGWLNLPLSWLSYRQAAWAWFWLEIACLLAALALWLRWQGQFGQVERWLIAGLALSAWPPLAQELWFGQLSVLLLLLLLAGGFALARGREVLGGAFIGSALVLKLMGGPLLLWLAWQRRWRALIGAAAFWLGAHLLAIGLHGVGVIRDYYLKVGPQVAAAYRGHDANLSIWTLGQRLLAGTKWDFVAPPLWEAPGLARVVGASLALSCLAAMLYAATRVKRQETAWALLLAGGVFLTPITWQHYFVMALPALALLVERLRAEGWPRGWTLTTALALLVLSLPHPLFVVLAEQFARGTAADGLAFVPTLPALLTLLPAAGLGAALLTLTQLEVGAKSGEVERSLGKSRKVWGSRAKSGEVLGSLS